MDQDKSDAASTAEEDFDFEDDDSEHQDYEANYFDNGEGEDDESGGGSGEYRSPCSRKWKHAELDVDDGGRDND